MTCGTFKWDFFKTRLLSWIDLIYFDIKCIDDHLHRQWTGRSNQGILANFSRLAKTAPDKVICSVPLIEGLTAGRGNFRLLAIYIGNSAALPYRLRAYRPGFHFKAKALGKIPAPYLPLHAMAPGEFNRIAAEFEKIVSRLNRKAGSGVNAIKNPMDHTQKVRFYERQ
jgi:pyruvate formate lyase activating enzyme